MTEVLMDGVAISARNISKKYNIYKQPIHRLKEYLSLGTRTYHQAFWALKDVSFDVQRGEAIGIIGMNGSGKSTLLQIVCDILRPTSGEVATQGRISALLELGAGFNPEYTGRDNVLINGQIMGLSLKEMEERFEEIADFADIGDFIAQPVKTYSSGMFVRLAFASAINVDPDILLIDEALAVGDAYCEEQRFEDAVGFWLRLVEAVPEQAHEVIERLKDTLFILGRFGDIVGICLNILDKYPKNIEVRRALAEFHLKKGDLDVAQEMLVQILEEQPNDTAALTELVRALLEQGNTRKLNDLLRTLENRREKRKAADPVRIAGAASLRS